MCERNPCQIILNPYASRVFGLSRMSKSETLRWRPFLSAPMARESPTSSAFFEMTSRMLRFRRLAEYVQQQGGADDQLFGGSKISPRVEAKLTMRTESGRNDYRFTLDLRSSVHVQRRGVSVQLGRAERGGILGTSRKRPLRGEDRRSRPISRAVHGQIQNRPRGHRYIEELRRVSVSRHLLRHRSSRKIAMQKKTPIFVHTVGIWRHTA